MNTTTFDALAAARALEDAGVPDDQAEATAEQLRLAAAADREQLATKTDPYRALAYQGLAIIGAIGVLIATAAALGLFGPAS